MSIYDDGLNLLLLRRKNVQRLPQFKDAKGRICHRATAEGPPGFDWKLSGWMTAVAGELGEAANIIKKIERGDFTLDEVRLELADELADVLTYLDLLAYRAGIDLSAATITKWNKISDRVGADVVIE